MDMNEVRFVLSLCVTMVASAVFGAAIMYAYLKGEGRIIPKSECNYLDEGEEET